MSVSSTGYNPSGRRSRQSRQDNRHCKCAYIFILHFELRLMQVFYYVARCDTEKYDRRCLRQAQKSADAATTFDRVKHVPFLGDS